MRRLMDSRRTAPVLGGLTILLVCAGAGCLGGYAAIGSYLEPDGTLTEPFFLVPLFWLWSWSFPARFSWSQRARFWKRWQAPA